MGITRFDLMTAWCLELPLQATYVAGLSGLFTVLFFIDIDECARWELHSCYGTCINTPGAFRCECPDGTYGNPSMEGGCVKNKNSSQGNSHYTSLIT
jgi:hypothetical protein